MVVGTGMMARTFACFADDASLLIFASGVSDSTETRESAFSRESDLLRRVRASHPDALLVYFGTCSAEDPDQRGTPYVRHKLAMESQLASAPGPWIVLRLPLAIGAGHRGNTLAKFLYERIVHGQPFEVWANATRYPIDVEDALRIARRLIADPSSWRRSINIALRAYPIVDFVHAFERILGKPASYTLVSKGQHYDLHCPEVAKLLDSLKLAPGDDYLDTVLARYFAPPSAGAA